MNAIAILKTIVAISFATPVLRFLKYKLEIEKGSKKVSKKMQNRVQNIFSDRGRTLRAKSLKSMPVFDDYVSSLIIERC
jgi:hypothetical protein